MLKLLSLALGTAVALWAQETRPAFEVASIKERLFAPGMTGVEFHPGGRVTATNASLFLLLMSAYHIGPSQIRGIPSAFNYAVYEIEAKPPAGAIPPGPLNRDSTKKLELMLQALLSDRFRLKLHTEKEELSIYALLQDKNGHKLRKAPDRDCSATPSPCRWSSGGPASGVAGQSVTVESLAEWLGLFGGRPIVDKTGITGKFDIRVAPWSRGAQTPGTLVDGVPVDTNAPSLAAVLQELGLRLESQKQIFDIFVIDQVEKPSEN